MLLPPHLNTEQSFLSVRHGTVFIKWFTTEQPLLCVRHWTTFFKCFLPTLLFLNCYAMCLLVLLKRWGLVTFHALKCKQQYMFFLIFNFFHLLIALLPYFNGKFLSFLHFLVFFLMCSFFSFFFKSTKKNFMTLIWFFKYLPLNHY